MLKWKKNSEVKFLTGIFANKHDDHIELTFALEQYQRYSKEYAEIAGHDNAYILR